MLLSKSLYIRGLQCQKSLWLKIHNSSLLSTEDQSKFETGNKVGLITRQLFPDGKEIKLTNPIEQIKKTKEYLTSGINTIYEATFEFDGVMIMVDILQIDDDDSINIYEVKRSTKVKPTHLDDVSIQYYVLTNLGYQIKSSNIICLNNKYIRGKNLDLKQLFLINDITDSILPLQPGKIEQLKSIIITQEPKVEIGRHCTSPYKCDAYDYCWKHILGNSIFNITNLSIKKKMALYSKGVITVDQIKDLSDFKKHQIIQIQSELNNEVYIDDKAISNFLEGITYPIYHLDFEFFQQAIPEWSGVKELIIS